MKLSELEARRLGELRLAGLSHAQALQRIKRARPREEPTAAQLRHRARAAAALRISQALGVSLAAGWRYLDEPAGFDGPAFGIQGLPELVTSSTDLTTSDLPSENAPTVLGAGPDPAGS